MQRVVRVFHIIFSLLSILGGLIVERPNRAAYALLVIFSMISHLTAVLIVIVLLCYSWRCRYAVR